MKDYLHMRGNVSGIIAGALSTCVNTPSGSNTICDIQT